MKLYNLCDVSAAASGLLVASSVSPIFIHRSYNRTIEAVEVFPVSLYSIEINNPFRGIIIRSRICPSTLPAKIRIEERMEGSRPMRVRPHGGYPPRIIRARTNMRVRSERSIACSSVAKRVNDAWRA